MSYVAPNMSEESYIVRIYRKQELPEAMRHANEGRRLYDRIALTGMVEGAEGGERLAFHNAEELWSALCGMKDQGLREIRSSE